MGTDGTIEISEREAYTNIYKESGQTLRSGTNLSGVDYLRKNQSVSAAGGSDAIASYESAPPDKYALPVE